MNNTLKKVLCTFLTGMLVLVQITLPESAFAEEQYIRQEIYSQDFNNTNSVIWTDALYSDASKTPGEWCYHGRTPYFEVHTSEADKCITESGQGYIVVTLGEELNKLDSGLYEINFDLCPGVNDGDVCFYLVSGTNPTKANSYPAGQWTNITMRIDMNAKTWFINGVNTAEGFKMADTINTIQILCSGNNAKFDNFKIFKLTENPNYDIYDEAIALKDKWGVVQTDLDNVDIKLGQVDIDFGDKELVDSENVKDKITINNDVEFEAYFEDGILSVLITSQRLDYNTTYTLTIEGLEIVGGKTVTKKEFSFKTMENKTIVSDSEYIEYEDFEDWTNDTCIEHYNDKYITEGGFRTWTATGIVSGKDGGNALTPMYGTAQVARGLQYYFVPYLEHDTFTVEFDYYPGDIENYEDIKLTLFRTKDGFGTTLIPMEGMTAFEGDWGHVKLELKPAMSQWKVWVTDQNEDVVYENLEGAWSDSDIRLFEWYVKVLDVQKLSEDANLPKIDNFVVNAVYSSASTLTEKNITIYEGDVVQSLSSASPASNKFVIDFGQRMMPDDMKKDNIYITSEDDVNNPVVTNDKYSDGKYELSPIDYLVPGKKYIIHIKSCRNVSGEEMEKDYNFAFTAGSGSVNTELTKITQNGTEVNSLANLSAGAAKLGVFYKNSTGKKYLLHYIIAFYNGNEMVHSVYATDELDAYAVGQISETDIKIPVVTEVYNEINIIAWDSFNGMLPVSESLVLK